MKYISTRGQAPSLSFEDAVLAGLASDGGLYVPETLPQFSAEEIASWAGLSYQELAFNIMSPFMAGEVPEDDLRELINKTYSTFRHDAIAPLVQTAHNEFILELFQGPTLAFKDFALQFLGNLLDYVLKKRDKRVVIMVARLRVIPVPLLLKVVVTAITSTFLFCILTIECLKFNAVR